MLIKDGTRDQGEVRRNPLRMSDLLVKNRHVQGLGQHTR